jgi:hypothetical protein
MAAHLYTLLFFLGRYVHIVCATLLVGGTLFYEMVVPIAIDDLRQEQQLLVFARARWVFKWIVWWSAILIVLSGVVSTCEHWHRYNTVEYYRPEVTTETQGNLPRVVPAAGRAGWWWAAHVSTGVIAVFIALSLTIGPVPPAKPIRWMRLNLVVLLLVIFLATATRQARLSAEQRHLSRTDAIELPER